MREFKRWYMTLYHQALTFTILCKVLQRKKLPNFSWIKSQKHQAGAGLIVHRVRREGLLWGQHWFQLALEYPRRLHWGQLFLNFVGIPPRISSKITSTEIQRCGELRESKWRNCIPTFVIASEHSPQSRHLRGSYVEIIIIFWVSESKWERSIGCNSFCETSISQHTIPGEIVNN